MTERRLTDNRDHLKHVAGLLTKLSYTDMRKFADMLGAHLAGEKDDRGEIAGALIKTADEILNEKPEQPEKAIDFKKYPHSQSFRR